MAEVVRCDICGCVDTPESTKFLELRHRKELSIFGVDASNMIPDKPAIKLDICDNCYRSIKTFIDTKGERIC